MVVVLSWTALQGLVDCGCYLKVGNPTRAQAFLAGGCVLLLSSLFLVLWLRRRDLEPSREAAVLFFWAFLVVLPGATYGVWRWDKTILAALTRRPYSGGTEVVLLYASAIISVIYAIVTLVWLNTTISAYEHAEPHALSARITRRIEAIFVSPYVK